MIRNVPPAVDLGDLGYELGVLPPESSYLQAPLIISLKNPSPIFVRSAVCSALCPWSNLEYGTTPDLYLYAYSTIDHSNT